MHTMKTLRILPLLLSVFIIGACSSGKRALEKGDYDKAVLQAVKRLRNDDDHSAARQTLRKGYKLAVQTHLREARQAADGMGEFRYERVLQHYRQLNNLHDEIQRCPSCLQVIPKPKYFQQEYQQALTAAAAERYRKAEELLKADSREAAREAYSHLNQVQTLIPGYRDSENLSAEALHRATLHVVLEPAPAPAGILQLDQEFFNARLDEYLHRKPIDPFVRFYSPEEARHLEWVDHRISLEFGRFSLGNLIMDTHEKQVSRDSILLSTRSDKEIYGTVTATFIVKSKALVGSGELRLEIEDLSTGRIVSRERFPNQYRWESKWATYRGDERALTEEELAMCRRKELLLPPPQVVFEEFAAPLYSQVESKIRSFYRRY